MGRFFSTLKIVLQIGRMFSDTDCVFSSKTRFYFVPFQSSGRLSVEKSQKGNTLLILGLTKQDQVTRQYSFELFNELLNIPNITITITFLSISIILFFRQSTLVQFLLSRKLR